MKLRQLFLIPLLALGLTAGGCAVVQKTADLLSAVTTTIINPVSQTELYQAKLAFSASQKLVLKYQQDCFGSQLPPYPVNLARIRSDPVLAVQCKRRVSRYNAMKKTEDRANAAILAADKFITQNPSGNAASYIAAAWAAVNEYKARAGG